MKIACIGNMNNNLFVLSRFLRDRGFDAQLFLLNSDVNEGWFPGNDTIEESNCSFSEQLDWGTLNTFTTTANGRDRLFKFYRRETDSIRKKFSDFQFIIGCGSAPAFLNLAGIKLDIFAPYGSDLFHLPHFGIRNYIDEPWFTRNHIGYQIDGYFFSRYQKRGIVESRFVTSGGGDLIAKGFRRLKVKGEKVDVSLPIIYTPEFSPEHMDNYLQKAPHLAHIRELRNKYKFIVLQHARHVWRPQSVHDNFSEKGNDKLIRGFAKALPKIGRGESCLLLVDYGPDVDASKKLINELGIEDNVFWLDKMPRKDVFACLRAVDVGASQFDVGFNYGGVVAEIMAMAKPMIGYRRDEWMPRYAENFYDMINVSSVDEIRQGLEYLAENAKARHDIGEQSHNWFKTYFVDRAVNKYCQLIETSRNN